MAPMEATSFHICYELFLEYWSVSGWKTMSNPTRTSCSWEIGLFSVVVLSRNNPFPFTCNQIQDSESTGDSYGSEIWVLKVNWGFEGDDFEDLFLDNDGTRGGAIFCYGIQKHLQASFSCRMIRSCPVEVWNVDSVDETDDQNLLWLTMWKLVISG